MGIIPDDELHRMKSNPEAVAMCLPGPAGSYTATCVSTNWFLNGNSQYPNRLLLSCAFIAQPKDGFRFRVEFNMSPEVWRLDPATKQPIKETEDNRASMEGWKVDKIFKRWPQAKNALEHLGAISDKATDEQIKEALTKYALTFHVGIFPRDGDPTNYIKYISRTK